MGQLTKLQNRKTLSVVGVMNGTSIDACDFVLCTVKKNGIKNVSIKREAGLSYPFPKALRQRLLAAASDPSAPLSEVARLHHDLGQFYAKTAAAIAKKHQWRPHLYAVHGQTVLHEGQRASVQIGEPSYLCQALGLVVVTDFRSADIAAGGQGAPIAPVLHTALAEKLGRPIAFHNLGGISNLTFADSKGCLAFDTGPASILLDAWILQKTRGKKAFDCNGATSAQGLVEPVVLKQLMKDPYLKKKAPKSCGREEYGPQFLKSFGKLAAKLSFEDQMATLTEFTAKSIEHSYRKLLPQLPKQIFLCGGGAKNTYLVSRIRYLLPEVEVKTTDELGWPVDNIEGGAVALLGAKAIWELKADFGAITGAKSSHVLGRISLP